MTQLPRGSTVRRDAGLYGYERALRRAGMQPIAGVDEAGRGACAGPLVAAAVMLPEGRRGEVPGLADSKLLTARRREVCYDEVVSRAVAWSVVVMSSTDCDAMGMHVVNIE
ncbi:MAG: ribonuclease HII, partial [Nocardioidaceae bacterium]